jgi:hypothetical protein
VRVAVLPDGVRLGGGAARRASDGTGARATVGAAAHRCGDGDGRRVTAGATAAGYGPGDVALDRGGWGASCRDNSGAREATVGWRGAVGSERRCRKRRGEREARGTSGRGVRGDAVETRGAWS